MTSQLPPGVYAPLVNDDFGDVYGVMLMASGDDYSYKDLLDYVDYVKRELALVPGVSKVTLAGQQQEQIFIEISLNKLASFQIDPALISSCLTPRIWSSTQAASELQVKT